MVCAHVKLATLVLIVVNVPLATTGRLMSLVNVSILIQHDTNLENHSFKVDLHAHIQLLVLLV